MSTAIERRLEKALEGQNKIAAIVLDMERQRDEARKCAEEWRDAPCSIQLKLSGPAQSYESRSVAHVCNGCRKAIVAAWDKLIKEKP